MIVFTTVYGNVVVGPTAVDQLDKLDRSTDFGTVRQLRGAIGVTFAHSPHLILTSSSPNLHLILTSSPPCPHLTRALYAAWGEKVCPSLKGAMIMGTYSGLRPATEHRDYQIRNEVRSVIFSRSCELPELCEQKEMQNNDAVWLL